MLEYCPQSLADKLKDPDFVTKDSEYAQMAFKLAQVVLLARVGLP